VALPPNAPRRVNAKHQWRLEDIKAFVDAAEYLRDKTFIMFAFQKGKQEYQEHPVGAQEDIY